MRLLFVPALVLALVRAASGGGCPASIDWDAAPEIARGMKYVHIALDEPRLMENFLVRIDLRTPGLRVASSGRASNWGAVMDDYTNSVMLVDVRRQRTRDFLVERRAHGTNMVLAVNTSPWGPWRPPFTFKYGRFAHFTVSAGEVVSHNVTRGDMLVIFTNNVAVITNALDDALLPSVAAAHPGHGDNVILRGGVSTVRPRKQLCGFRRVSIGPGECVTVTIPLPRSAFELVNASYERVLESGEFEIQAGASSEDIRQTINVSL